MQINILTQHVVQTQGPPTICSGPRHTRSCVVFLQHYYMRRPGALCVRAPKLLKLRIVAQVRHVAKIERASRQSTGVTPPFSKSMLFFFLRASPTLTIS